MSLTNGRRDAILGARISLGLGSAQTAENKEHKSVRYLR